MTAGSNQTEFLSLGRKLAADGKTHVQRKRDQSATFSLQCPVPDVGAQGIALFSFGGSQGFESYGWWHVERLVRSSI